MPKLSHLLIDLDGTILDSKEGILKSIAFALTKLGLPVPSTQALEQCIGPPIHQNFARLLGTSDRPLIEQAVQLYRERYATDGIYEATVYPHIKETLEKLMTTATALFIATAKPKFFADQMLQHLSLTHYFNATYGSELNGERGDKGDLITYLLQKETLQKNDVAMIGDRHHDITGAKRNGVFAVGVTWGYGTAQELNDAGADHIVSAPQELVELFS